MQHIYRKRMFTQDKQKLTLLKKDPNQKIHTQNLQQNNCIYQSKIKNRQKRAN